MIPWQLRRHCGAGIAGQAFSVLPRAVRLEAKVKTVILIAALAVAPAPLVFAHHSFAAEYQQKLITLHATITKFVWMNPHTRLYFDVTGPDGTVAHWEAEGSAPGGLMSNGWNKGTLKPGDRVTIEAWPAKDRENDCKVRSVILANGRRLVMGANGNQPGG